MEEVTKNHTCSHHILRDGTCKLKKGTDLDSLERAIIVLKFSSPIYPIWVDLCYEYGLEETFAFENLQLFEKLKISMIFFFG